MNNMTNNFNELMSYFYFEFFIYSILAIIVLICTIKAIVQHISLSKNKQTSFRHGISDLIITILCGLGLFSAILFQGVISDILSELSVIWVYKIFALCIIVFSLFIVQVILFLIRKTSKSK